MKRYTLLIGVISLALNSFSAPTLCWTVDLNSIENLDGYSLEYPSIQTFSDGSTAILLEGSSSQKRLLLISVTGEKLFSTNVATHGFTNFANDKNVFAVSLAGGDSIRFFSKEGDTYTYADMDTVNIYPGGDGSATEREVYTLSGSHLSKYIFDLESPTLASSASGIQNGNYVISWQSKSGVDYQIQESTDLESWNPVGVPIVGTGDGLSWSTSMVSTSKFYRVILQ